MKYIINDTCQSQFTRKSSYNISSLYNGILASFRVEVFEYYIISYNVTPLFMNTTKLVVGSTHLISIIERNVEDINEWRDISNIDLSWS
jgi:hypothetical protein